MLPLKEADKQNWIVELQEAEKFRDKEFGTYRQGGSKTLGAGRNLDYFEYGAAVSEEDGRAPINLAFVLAKNIVPLLFPQNPRVLGLPTTKQDADTAPIAATILNHYLRLLKLKETDQQVVFDTWLLGYGVSKTGYLSDNGADIGRTEAEDRQRLRDKLKLQANRLLSSMGLAKPKEPEAPKVLTDHEFAAADTPYVRWVDPFDFLIDPRARSIASAYWVAESARRTLEEVKRTARFSNRHELVATPIESNTLPETQVKRFEQVRLHEIHYKNPDAPNGVTILILGEGAGKWVTLYHEHSSYRKMKGWQYDLLAFNKHNHRLYPVSDLSQVRPLLMRLNNTFEAILEQVDKFVSKVIVNTEQVQTEGQLALQNGEIGSLVKCTGDPNAAVRVINMDQIKSDLVMLVEKILDLIVLVTGLTRAELTGLTTAQTATEAQIGQGGTQNRRSDKIDAVMSYVTDQVEKLWAVITEFVDLETIHLLVGEPEYQDETGLPTYRFMDDFSPDQTVRLREGEYRFQIEVTSMQRPNLEILRQQVANVATILTNTAIHQQLALQGKMFDVAEALRIWMKLYPELIADVNRLIRPISPPVAQGIVGGAPGAPAGTPEAPSPTGANMADLISQGAGEKGQGAPLA